MQSSRNKGIEAESYRKISNLGIPVKDAKIKLSSTMAVCMRVTAM